jgi:translocation and assembly module TamB
LHNGLLRTEPIRCELGTGEVNVMPQWDMNTNFVQLASGSRIQNLQVTPELSGEWLGFLAPMMAEAANVQGTVSARVQQFDYYMDSPSTSTIVGQLSLLNTSASPGQSIGPLIQVLDLVGRSDAGQSRDLVFPNQDIPFELRNGMVLHDGLQVGFGKYMLSSRGGVGLDKRVQLVLTVPLEANAAGRTLEIPVGGTVDRPQLDTSGLLQNLGRQQIQNQVDKQLNGGLNKLLDKFR